jgi:Protein of unknown function (DUF3606)
MIKRRPVTNRRSIDVADDEALKYWSRALGIDKALLIVTVQKVGSSAAAVRKELKFAVGRKV